MTGGTQGSSEPFQWANEYLTKEMIVIVVVSVISFVYIFGCVLAFSFKCLLNSCSRKTFDPSSKKRVLIITAHPDDECMFFGPTIVNFVQASKRNLFVLCLSNGNHGGLGTTRKKELWQSCYAMGILSSNITLLKYDKLPDDPNMEWASHLVGRAIIDHVNAYDIDLVVTFDVNGVSGHKNHIAISRAINVLLAQNQWPKFCQICVLESVNIFRKYVASFLDLAFSYWTSKTVYFVDLYQRSSIVSAMECHASQLVWYRKLYLIFSRYIIINTLKEIYVAQPRQAPSEKDKDE